MQEGDSDIPFTETMHLGICSFLVCSHYVRTATAVVIMRLVPFHSSALNKVHCLQQEEAR